MNQKAGWYRDPTGRRRSRYWDGQHWTSRVNEFHGQDPLAADETLAPPDPESLQRAASSASPAPNSDRTEGPGHSPVRIATPPRSAGRLLAGLVVLGAAAALVMVFAPLAVWWSEPGGSLPGPYNYDRSPTGFQAMDYRGWQFPGLHCPVGNDMGGDCIDGVVLTGGLPLLSGILVVALLLGPAWTLWRRSAARKWMVVTAAVIAGASAAAAVWTSSTIGAIGGPGIRIWLASSVLAAAALTGCLGLAAFMVRRMPDRVVLQDAEPGQGQPADWLVPASVVGIAALVLVATGYEPLLGFAVGLGLLAVVFVMVAVSGYRQGRARAGGRRCPYCDAPLNRWARRCRTCHMTVRRERAAEPESR